MPVDDRIHPGRRAAEFLTSERLLAKDWPAAFTTSRISSHAPRKPMGVRVSPTGASPARRLSG